MSLIPVDNFGTVVGENPSCFGSRGTKAVPFWDELKLVQKTMYRKYLTQNGPRSNDNVGGFKWS